MKKKTINPIVMYTLACFAALGPMRLAADNAAVTGSWTQNGGGASWVIRAIPGGLHITQTDHAATIADFDCHTDGQDCSVKIGGHKATVSIYYNGAALIELETKGSEIVKRRFDVQPSGAAMKIEVTTMSGKVETEHLEFQRAADGAH